MQRALGDLALRLRLADLISHAGGALSTAPAAAAAAATTTSLWQHTSSSIRRFASDSSNSAPGEEPSSTSTSDEPSVSSSSTPSIARQPSHAPTFASGARLVQPLRRGGSQVQAQEGIVHINCSLNNTFVVLTDLQGQVKTYTSGGSVGFKNANKSSPLAAERAAAELARRALEKGFYSVSVRLRGMGRNKQIAVQALAAAGVSVTQLREVTPTPYNGCRLPRKRRV